MVDAPETHSLMSKIIESFDYPFFFQFFFFLFFFLFAGMTCCQRLSKGYVITTNLLFACFGFGLMIFGVMGFQHRFDGSVLFPVNILKMINILGIIITFTAIIGIIGAFLRGRQTIHILYTAIVLIAFVYQISIAVIVYDQTAHMGTWLSHIWYESPTEYRAYAQDKLSCCGFSHVMDHTAVSKTCSLDMPPNAIQPCHLPLTAYTKKQLSTVYIILFAALSIELLALCNAITLLCSPMVGDRPDLDDDPEHFHRRSPSRRIFKSNAVNNTIQLDDFQSNPEWKSSGQRSMVDSAIANSCKESDGHSSFIQKHP
ncbi:uncharacterized protein BYT42DRAFT_555560 [Radiomyces spectabilis]|uniref:uncharacterized protein n=1 Tax=Radiomyces spectabilis TaxID=64574 RepID=UPI00221E9CBF|nr:uncharacterized protein BYT42DRAFT_555560 [Radiomyces spectabilis]KAI8391094.1 hypothetical protein BYT42DRAFT_555560 [Radiomyces spectabilis]